MKNPMKNRSCDIVLVACVSLLFAASAEAKPQIKPLVRVVDLKVGESQEVELCDGSRAMVKLLDLKEMHDDIRGAIRVAQVEVEINGKPITLNSGNYHLPVTAGRVQIDCPITRGYYANTKSDAWGLDKDRAARLRLWPAGSPLIKPGTFIRPVEQRWFASRTWMSNQPVDGGPRITRDIYYHSGLDIGGAEGLVEVIAATDGLVVSSGLNVLDQHKQETPVQPRYDVVYVMDRRGWYYRYSHLKEIDEAIKPGRIIRLGDRIGVLGKEGGSGGWSHLHFEIKSRQPSGKWGTQEGYAFLWEAYQQQHKPKLIAVARPSHLARVGEKVVLDGSRSWSAGGKIAQYEWISDDGATQSGVRVERTYPRAGTYSEVLKITDPDGMVDYDFTSVLVIDNREPDRFPPFIHAAYFPTFGIKTGAPVTFKVRTFYITEGHETWDFGDGSEPVKVQSDGNADQHAKDGYAVTTHRFEEPGHYVVRVERTNKNGIRAVGHLQVRVGAPSSEGE